MIRSIALLVIGALAGAVAVLMYADRAADDAQTRSSLRPSTLTASELESLTTTDRDAALAELGTIDRPATRRAVALALVEVLGYDAETIETVAQKLPASEAWNFRFDALAARAVHDPTGAIEAALAFEHLSSRQEAIARIARTLAMTDPPGALALAASLDDYELAATFASRTLGTWATFDPDSVFAYLETADLDLLPDDSSALPAIAAVAPERLLAIADRLPSRLQVAAQSVALERVAERDLGAAITFLDSIAADESSANLGRWAEIVAQVYARQDPAGAVAWAGSLPETGRRGALDGIASVDPMTAIDYRVDEIEGRRETDSTRLLSNALDALLKGSSGTQYTQVALVFDRMIAIDDLNHQAQLGNLIDQWIRHDADSAVIWMASNPERLPANLVTSAAIEIGGIGSEPATELLDRIASDQRARWMGGLAMGMAARDFRGALEWVSRYEGQAGYADAVADMLTGATGILSELRTLTGNALPQGAAIAEFLDGTERSIRATHAASAALQWAAEDDPAAVAVWALNLDLDPADEQSRIDAIANVASRWTDQDADAATLWALGLPAGAMRDAAIGRVIWGSADRGATDARLLNAFSSDAARQQALMTAMIRIGQTDLGLGRRLIETYFVDPALREQAEELLVLGSTGQAPSIIVEVR